MTLTELAALDYEQVQRMMGWREGRTVGEWLFESVRETPKLPSSQGYPTQQQPQRNARRRRRPRKQQ